MVKRLEENDELNSKYEINSNNIADLLEELSLNNSAQKSVINTVLEILKQKDQNAIGRIIQQNIYTMKKL